MKLKQKTTNKLSAKLMGFLPILKVGSEDLFEEVKKKLKDLPVEIVNKRFVYESSLNANTDKIEALSIYKASLYEELISQIDSKYFPTQKSKNIALEIIKDINNEGFFEGDEKEIAKKLGVKEEEVKKVRERFMFLEPVGVGAKDLKEAFLFQLYNLDIGDEVLTLAIEMVKKLEKLEEFEDRKYYKEALNIIRQLKITPAVEFIHTQEIVPEIIVIEKDEKLEIFINDEVYPKIEIEDKNLFSKDDLQKVRAVIESLGMRKSTLKKIALMIVELQYEFFKGGVLKPMRIQDIAQELEYNASTISRAIANKYILCNRGLFSLKYFFSIALDDEISALQIKEEIKKIIKNENKEKPLNDDKLTEIINKKFNLKLVRRTISKYRDALNIPASRERKKLYKKEINFL
jgi:RNA polymerase sigma-54 factor